MRVPLVARYRLATTEADDNIVKQSERSTASASNVTVVIVSYHSSHCIQQLAPHLAACPHVTVVDNSNSDEEVAAIKAALPHASVLSPGRNLGFGAANNLGTRGATTEFVALLNPDCLATASDLASLTDCLERFPEASASAPQLMDRAGALDLSYRASRQAWTSSGPAATGPTCVGYASGALLVVRRACLEQIQGFDEAFFLYYEDDDLCIRLARHCGPIIVDPDIRVTHLSRQSSKLGWNTRPEFLRGFHHIQSKFLFQSKHMNRSAGLGARARYVITGALEAIVRLLILDIKRCARSLGRSAGALLYSPNVRHP